MNGSPSYSYTFVVPGVLARIKASRKIRRQVALKKENLFGRNPGEAVERDETKHRKTGGESLKFSTGSLKF